MDTQKIHNDLVKSMHEFEMRVKTLREKIHGLQMRFKILLWLMLAWIATTVTTEIV
jgi:chaperonin cofactor prefoldin